jgi:hypothetical protein
VFLGRLLIAEYVKHFHCGHGAGAARAVAVAKRRCARASRRAACVCRRSEPCYQPTIRKPMSPRAPRRDNASIMTIAAVAGSVTLVSTVDIIMCVYCLNTVANQFNTSKQIECELFIDIDTFHSRFIPQGVAELSDILPKHQYHPFLPK